ncbi:MAG TPA: universal stress protein [Verrucomicrobiae bacterium]|jgi:nucleotide-binding universal stress UspA family protein|nr:universal stress protein [Verrucomicrobiae bacterium]
MKIKPSKVPGSVVMEADDQDFDRLSKPAMSPFKLNTIVVPIDFSACSKKALQYALPLAKQFGAAIVLLHVVPRRCTIAGEARIVDYEPGLEKSLRRNAAQQLKDFAAELYPHDVRIRIEACLGAEALEIAAEAKILDADLIVISTHGRTGRARALVGSVAENLVQLAPCPVLVVREHEREFIEEETAMPLSRAAAC